MRSIICCEAMTGIDWQSRGLQRNAGVAPLLEHFLCQRFFAGRIISQGEAARGGSQFGRSSQANLVPNKFCWSRNFSRFGDGGPWSSPRLIVSNPCAKENLLVDLLQFLLTRIKTLVGPWPKQRIEIKGITLTESPTTLAALLLNSGACARAPLGRLVYLALKKLQRNNSFRQAWITFQRTMALGPCKRKNFAMTISSLIPDSAALLALRREQLGCPLLKVINSLPDGQRNRYNYLISPDSTFGYPQNHHERIKEAQNEAWEWLRSEGYVAPRPGSSNRDFVYVTQKGREYLKTCSDQVSTSAPTSPQGQETTETDAGVLSQQESLPSEDLANLPPWQRAALAARCVMRVAPLFVPTASRPIPDAKADLIAIEVCWMVAALAGLGKASNHDMVGRVVGAALRARDAVGGSPPWGFDAANAAWAAAHVAWNSDSAPQNLVEEAERSHEPAFAKYSASASGLITISSKATACLSKDFIALRELVLGPEPDTVVMPAFFERSLWFGELNPLEFLSPLLGPWRIKLYELGLKDVYERHVRMLHGGGIDWEDAERRIQGWAAENSLVPVAQTGMDYVRVAANIQSPKIPAGRPSLRMLADTPLTDDDADRLDFKPYADALAGLIDSPNTATPLTLAINAPWGAGKTTLSMMIKRRLEQKLAADEYLPHATCWFNAWMHDDASHLASAFAAYVAHCANHFRSPVS